MIDIKTSILSKKDYSKENYESALEYVKVAFQKGVKKIIFTSELNSDEYVSRDEMKRRISELQKGVKDLQVKGDICYAQVVNISYDTLKECLSDNVETVNESRYVLVDAGSSLTDEKVEMIFELTIKGMIPVVLHPETYPQIIEKNSRIEKLKEFGCLFALNINNLDGKNGAKTRTLAKKFLSSEQYQFVCSEETTSAKDSVDRLKAYLSKSQGEKLYKNSLKMIKNQLVDNNSERVVEKKGLLDLIRK